MPDEARTLRVAALQLEPRTAEVGANLEHAARIAHAAGESGAALIVLPEFFSTGMAFDERLRSSALPPEGPATEVLLDVARRHQALVGGSFLCLDADGEVRNAFFLAGPTGILGRHDKDLPTMWENCFYAGGSDDGVIEADGLRFGASLCWEFMRGRTAARLRGRVDAVVGGSAWWSIPRWVPQPAYERMESRNEANALHAPLAFARLVGAPVVHAAICGDIDCRMPWTPVRYRGRFEGCALVCEASGNVLAARSRAEGAGFAIADIMPGSQPPSDPIPEDFWLHRRGVLPALAWAYQRVHGRRWRERHDARPATLPSGRESETVASERLSSSVGLS